METAWGSRKSPCLPDGAGNAEERPLLEMDVVPKRWFQLYMELSLTTKTRWHIGSGTESLARYLIAGCNQIFGEGNPDLLRQYHCLPLGQGWSQRKYLFTDNGILFYYH